MQNIAPIGRRGEGNGIGLLSASGDEVKREMREVVNSALAELKARFGDNVGRLCELHGGKIDGCKYNARPLLHVLLETL